MIDRSFTCSECGDSVTRVMAREYPRFDIGIGPLRIQWQTTETICLDCFEPENPEQFNPFPEGT